MPTLRRPRVVLIAAALALVVGLILSALPDRSDPRASVGTEDDRAVERDRDDVAGAADATDEIADVGDTDHPVDPDGDGRSAEASDRATSDEDEAVVETGPRGSIDPRRPGSTTTTKPRRNGSTTTTHPPGSTTSTTAPPTPTGPHDLLGRVLYMGASGETGEHGLRSMLPDATDSSAVVTCPDGWDASEADLSPDGTEIVRWCPAPAESLPESVFPMYDLLVIRVDGGGHRRLLHRQHPGNGTPRWSPDGERIAVPASHLWPQNDNGGGPQKDLLLLDADGSNPSLLDAGPGQLPAGISWSPDGHRIALRNEQVRVLDVSTGTTSVAWDEVPPGSSVAWDPAGNWIVVGHDAPGTSYDVITRVSPDGTARQRLLGTLRGVWQSGFTFTPDGSRLLFRVWGGAWVSMRPDGTDRRLIKWSVPDDDLGWVG